MWLYRNYYKSALDKLSVKFHIFKVGTFKDFVEPYTRNDMSEASKQHNSEWINELWGLYTNRVESQRHLESGSLDKLINNTSEALLAAGNSAAQMALNAKLVDHIGNRVSRMQELIARFGADPDVATQYLHVSYAQYKHELASKNTAENKGNIGLIVASGSIIDGEQPDGNIGGDTLAQLLRKAREDKDISALILRIDSGGGSAFASEVIRQEMQAVRAAGKSIYVSMGSVAASGGYWIASAADEIWATPFTITGSIGVFGLFPTVDEGLNKIGVYTDGIGTHKLSGAMRPDRPLDPAAEKVAQQGVEAIYQRFLTIVGEARKQEPAQILEEIHRALSHTRGAAVAVARINHRAGELTYSGLGNISGMVLHHESAQTLMTLDGIVGQIARRFHTVTYPWNSDSILVMHSDGLSARVRLDSDAYPGILNKHPQLIASLLMRDARRGKDDATVLVAKGRPLRSALQ
ncbi:MAG: signal peptide peptidase SppA [Cytophagaceae bacterium]|nr:MAG: signal peptide peptidase SppA [Cytophagaceae bacterium]